jgi:hypothetical protein
MKTILAAALTLGLFAAPAIANEQPHTAPIVKVYGGGQAGPDVGSEQGGSFFHGNASPLRAGGNTARDVGSETAPRFDASRATIVGLNNAFPVRMAALR